MPKLSDTFFASCKKFNRHKPIVMKYRIWTPPILTKNKITEKKDSILKERPCHEEVKTLLDCFKTHDFDQSRCTEQLQRLRACMNLSREREKTIKETGSQSQVINRLLAKYPNHKVTLKLKGEK